MRVFVFLLYLCFVLGLGITHVAPKGKEEKRFATQESDIKGMGQSYQYIIINERQIWHYARNACQNRGGDLATITSLTTFNRLLEFLKTAFPDNDYYWVGAEKQDTSSTWKWTSGEPIIAAMTTGKSSVPSAASKGCMILHPALKGYVSSPGLCIHDCYQTRKPYICEIH